MNTCSGCVEIPTPIYYWNPYLAQAYSKTSAFQIANILQLSQSTVADNSRHSKRARVEITRNRRDEERHELLHEKNFRVRSGTNDDRSSNRILDFSKKSDGKCTAPSALEPLQALCSVGPKGYRSSSPCTLGGSHSTKTSPSPPRDLKFGINKILSEDFGKERGDKGKTILRYL